MKCHARQPGAMERSEASHGKVPGRAGSRRRSLRRHLFFRKCCGIFLGFWSAIRRERGTRRGPHSFLVVGRQLTDPLLIPPGHARPRAGPDLGSSGALGRGPTDRGGDHRPASLAPHFLSFLSFPTPTPTPPIPPPTIPRSRVSVELPAHVAELALYAGCRPPGDLRVARQAGGPSAVADRA